MPTVHEQTITIQRGDDWGPHTVRLRPASGTLVGAVVAFMIKRYPTDEDADALISLRSDDASPRVLIVDSENATIELTAEETSLLTSALYHYDVSTVTQAGKRITGVKGRAIIGWQVNQALA